MGRLFDAVSSLAGVCHHAGYEAQAAVELEGAAVAAGGADADPRYAFRLAGTEPVTADPGPLLGAVADDVRAGVPAAVIAARFHLAVARLVRAVCAAARAATGLRTVALSGGVFANALLSSACARGLGADGFTVLRHHAVPPNDGGLALGQLVVAARAASRPPHPGDGRGPAAATGVRRQVCAWRSPAECWASRSGTAPAWPPSTSAVWSRRCAWSTCRT
ncbi:hypothetical protein GCM10020295_74730 [Streptomyces cinereospinus]